MGLFDFFDPGKKMRKDFRRGSQQRDDFLTSGASSAIGTRKDYGSQQQGFFEPYAQAGQGALGLQSDYLGLNGPDAQSGFFDNIPLAGLDQASQYGIRSLDRSAAARGGLYSGAHAEDLSDYNMRLYQQFAEPYINRVFGAAGQGANIAGAQSGIAGDVGGYVADTQFGLGQLRGNNAIDSANAMASTRGMGINNLIGLLGVGAKLYGGLGGLGGRGDTGQWDTRVYPGF